ncbi:unnamed protein product [Urochloa humidicola]
MPKPSRSPLPWEVGRGVASPVAKPSRSPLPWEVDRGVASPVAKPSRSPLPWGVDRGVASPAPTADAQGYFRYLASFQLKHDHTFMAWLVSCHPDGTRKDFTAPALSFRPSLNLDPEPSQKRLTRLCEEAPFSFLPSSPALAGAMSQRAKSSALRNQMSELVGAETGLPMMICPSCKRARVFEAQSQKENKNHGRVYVKCPRYVSWVVNKCDYYWWQKEYFEDLVAAKVIRVFLLEEDEIQEV